MTTYISILRGINVSGQRPIKMDALRKMYETLSFENVQTYIQSGNVIFSTQERDTKELGAMISSKIKTDFGFDVPVIVLSVKTLKEIVENNPFAKDNQKDTAFLHVTFLADNPTDYDEAGIIAKKQPNEEMAITPNAVYLYCPNGYATTKLSNNFLETRLKVQATTRNWKTTNELLKLAVK